MRVKSIQGFGKQERLSSKKDIQELFDRGSSFYFPPLRMRYLPVAADPLHQVIISVPKRLFKRAVDRNLLKRRTREAYRKTKFIIDGLPAMHIAFIIISRDKTDQAHVDRAMETLLKRLKNPSDGINS